jgi:hypothetical protein
MPKPQDQGAKLSFLINAGDQHCDQQVLNYIKNKVDEGS